MTPGRLRPRSASVGLLGIAALAVGAVSTGGCRPDFPPYNRITGLRVLAIKSEPAAPITGETAEFSALVVTPMPAPAIAYAWSWCPFAGDPNDGYTCVVKEQEIDAALADGGLPPLPAFDLGTAPTATFSNDVSPAVFAAVCQGGFPGQPAEFKLDCSAGFPIQIMLTVKTDTDSLTAVQTVKLRFDDSQPPNNNPIIDDLGVILSPGGVTTSIPSLMPDPDLPAPEPVTLPRDKETPLRVTMSETTADSYYGLDNDKVWTKMTERLYLTWFVESGDTNDPRTSFISGSTPFADMLKNRWTPAKVKDYPADSSRIYVVAHDNRGGVSWRAGTVNLEPTP